MLKIFSFRDRWNSRAGEHLLLSLNGKKGVVARFGLVLCGDFAMTRSQRIDYSCKIREYDVRLRGMENDRRRIAFQLQQYRFLKLLVTSRQTDGLTSQMGRRKPVNRRSTAGINSSRRGATTFVSFRGSTIFKFRGAMIHVAMHAGSDVIDSLGRSELEPKPDRT